jgi:hypothetical protein
VWLGSRASRRRAAQAASSGVVTRTEDVEAISLPCATEQMEASIDQDTLVRELGKRLGLEEPTAALAAVSVSDDSFEPVSEPEPAAPQIAAAIPSKQGPLIVGANFDTTR